jgi:hypothetical protein
MGGFLRAFVPLGEAGGDYLQQRSIVNYGNQMRQRQTQALMESFKQLGPEGETLAGEIGRGLPPDAAANLLPLLQKRQFQKTLSDMLQKSGGKITPEIYAAAQEAGVNLGPLMKSDQISKTFQLGGPSGNRVEGLTGGGDIRDLGPAPSKAGAGVKTHYYTGALNGMPMTFERKEDADGNLISDEPIRQGKLPATQQNQLNAVNDAQSLAKGLRDDYAKVEPKYKQNGAGWMFKQWSLYSPNMNPFGVRGEPDADVKQWFGHVGQIKTDLLQAAAGNSRNLAMINDLFGPHVPSEWQSPDAVIGRIEAFENEGRFDAIKSSVLGVPAGGAMGGPPPGGSVNLNVPGMAKRKHLGWAPDGREVVEGADGKPAAVSP